LVGVASRRGFTIVELLLALFALNVAVLALVAGGTITLRRTTELRERGAAVEAATNRVERLSAGPCAAATGFAAVADLDERWAVALVAPAVREIVDSVSYRTGVDSRTLVLRTRSPC
jgi:Tfp pilus assembly protein PilV